jgi:hypothetical protein
MHTTVDVATQVVGEVFTIAGVYACHPETKQSLGYLQQFTITAIGLPRPRPSRPGDLPHGAKQNVCKSDGTQLATTDFNSQTLTFIGSASTAYKYGLMYHRDAFAFARRICPSRRCEIVRAQAVRRSQPARVARFGHPQRRRPLCVSTSSTATRRSAPGLGVPDHLQLRS